MKIYMFFRKTFWLIFLASCIPTPNQTGNITPDLITPSAAILTVPIMMTIIPPTLSPQDRETTIKELMATNAGCSLPCFWGITPGATEWENANKFLEAIGATVGDIEINPGTNYHSVVFKDEKLTAGDNFGFLESLGVIDSIFASGNLHGSVRNVKDFTSLWETYSPKEVISKYGIPSRILLSSVFAIGVGDTGRHGYILWVFYDHLGFMIRYDGTVADLPIYHICPEFEDDGNITRIDLIMQNPSNSSPLELHDSILAKSTVPRVILPIEDAARIDTEEFYNLFVRDNSQSCFDTPRDIWAVK